MSFFPPFSIPVLIPPSNWFVPPTPKSLCDLKAWFDGLILCGGTQPKDGQNWGFYINGVVYSAIWRDKPPRPPWTRAVWDVFVHTPPCGSCPSTSRGLGWFWCWKDVLDVVFGEMKSMNTSFFSNPENPTIVIGTNVWKPSSFEKEVGPVLWLSPEGQKTISGGKVLSWSDSSGFERNVDAENVSAPSEVLLGGKSFVSFSGSQWMRLNLLPSLSSWHIFVVGRFSEDLINSFGTILGAMSLSPPFPGIETLISQNGVSKGTLGLWNEENFVSGTFVSPESSITLWEWSQGNGEAFGGINGTKEKISNVPSSDVWEKTPSVSASIGRSNRGNVLGEEFFYFRGELGEIIVYPVVLPHGKRLGVLNFLREKYSLGPPIVQP